MKRATIGVLVLLLFCTACSPSRQDADMSPAELVTAFEQRLLDADSVHVDFSISSSGAVVSVFQGRLEAARENRVRCTAEGAFMGRDVCIDFTADEQDMRLDTASWTTAPALREGLLLGMVRMGLLHNLARMTAGNPPDHKDGGFAAWARFDSLATAAGNGAVTFFLQVGGEPAAEGELRFDESGVLTGRTQTVHFGDEDMTVQETFTRLTIFD